jgi:hypothetical protein
MFRSFTAALFFCGMSVLNLASAATTTQIVNAGNRLCVGVAKASTDAAAPVSQIACNGTTGTTLIQYPCQQGVAVRPSPWM